MDLNTQKGIKERVEVLIDKGTDVAQKFYELTSTKINKKIAAGGSNSLFVALIIVLSSILILFLALALAFWLATLFNSNSLGFLTTAGIFLLLIIILIATKKKLILYVKNVIIKNLYEDED